MNNELYISQQTVIEYIKGSDAELGHGSENELVCKDIKELPSVTLYSKNRREKDFLDKIKAEIEDIAFDWQEIDGEHEKFMIVDLNDILNIIDKYKAECEVK